MGLPLRKTSLHLTSVVYHWILSFGHITTSHGSQIVEFFLKRQKLPTLLDIVRKTKNDTGITRMMLTFDHLSPLKAQTVWSPKHIPGDERPQIGMKLLPVLFITILT